MKLTAKDLLNLKIIDEVIPEPLGGAHRNPNEVFTNLKKEISKSIILLKKKSKNSLAKERKLKYLKFGANYIL